MQYIFFFKSSNVDEYIYTWSRFLTWTSSWNLAIPKNFGSSILPYLTASSSFLTYRRSKSWKKVDTRVLCNFRTKKQWDYFLFLSIPIENHKSWFKLITFFFPSLVNNKLNEWWTYSCTTNEKAKSLIQATYSLIPNINIKACYPD